GERSSVMLSLPPEAREALAVKRREFIALLGGAAAAWPLAASAQQTAGIRRVGMLINLSETDLEAQRLVTAFRERLTQLGWVDGRNLRVDYRWAAGDVGRLKAFASELVELSPDILVCVLQYSRRHWAPSGWRLSNRYRLASDGSLRSSIQRRHLTTRCTCARLRKPLRHSLWSRLRSSSMTMARLNAQSALWQGSLTAGLLSCRTRLTWFIAGQSSRSQTDIANQQFTISRFLRRTAV